MAVELYEHQIDAVKQMHNGCILVGNVGTGKSRVALAYYLFVECNGRVKVNGKGSFREMSSPKDLFIITTAKKRDSGEWLTECAAFNLFADPKNSISHVHVVVDSWNNISKYKNVYNSFFIFDEQRVVGFGKWSKMFIRIAKRNHWVLLSATPGDKWVDYIPVFVANGYYLNKSEFLKKHVLFSRFAKYPKIIGYFDVPKLENIRKDILVPMADRRITKKKHIDISTTYDRDKYRKVVKEHWDPYDNEPIQETGKLCYLMRKVVNSDKSRITAVRELLLTTPRSIIFYNFNYELDILRGVCEDLMIPYAEWNGQKHEEIPSSNIWAYLVQYSAGAEGWNCIKTDSLIFYSQSYSYRMTTQAAGRIDRLNTPYLTLYYYHLKSNASIDTAIEKAIEQKRDFNERSFISAL